MVQQKKGLTEFKKYSYIALNFGAGLIRSVFQTSLYCIKRGYLHQKKIVFHDDRGFGEVYQKEVYQKAAEYMLIHQWTSVIDIGCGSGYKLIKYLGDYQILGIDFEPVISQAQNDYPSHAWLKAENCILQDQKAQLIICADMIEHVEDPDEFMKSVISIKNWKCIMISTPERNLRRGRHHYGPPPNCSHWREWSKKEFFNFISKYLQVHIHEIINPAQATQLIICIKHSE